MPFTRRIFNDGDVTWSEAPNRAIADLNICLADKIEECLSRRRWMPITLPTWRYRKKLHCLAAVNADNWTGGAGGAKFTSANSTSRSSKWVSPSEPV
jgi:hypothetical protein